MGTVTTLTHAVDTSDTSFTTGDVTPNDPGVWVLWVFAQRTGSADPPEPGISGLGLTWTFRGSQLADPDTNHRGLFLFTGVGTPDESGAVTIDFGGVTIAACGWDLWEVLEGDLTDDIVVPGSVKGAKNNADALSISVALDAAANSANRPAAASYHTQAEAMTPRTNWTEKADMTPGGGQGFETEWRDDAFETTASVSWASMNASAILACELGFASATPAGAQIMGWIR